MKYGLLTYNCNSANKHAEKSEEKAVSERLEKLLWWWVSFAHFVLLSAEWFHYLPLGPVLGPGFLKSVAKLPNAQAKDKSLGSAHGI